MSALAHFTSRRCIGALFVGALATLGLGPAPHAIAHDTYTAYVQHRAHLTVGDGRFDVTLDLTFFEEWSLRERKRMDADADGRLSKAELRQYADRLAPQLAQRIKLVAAGEEIPLVPLYEPEVDLLGFDKAAPGHHRLRLFFFAPEPPRLQAGDELILKDRFWPDAKALAALELDGKQGCELEAGKPRLPGPGIDQGLEGISFLIRCVTPPNATPQPDGGSRAGP